MKSVLIKRIIYTTLLVIWMIIIFMFSSENGIASKNRSDNFAKSTVNITSKINKINAKDKERMVNKIKVVVRKVAHFTLYFVLGALVYLTFSSYGINKNIIIYSIGFCMLYALSDEIHQIYTKDRSFQVLDILNLG